MLRYAQFQKPPAVAAQSALVLDCLPAFASENRFNLLDDTVLPRIWLSNRITTPTHVNEWNTIGCVIAGRRRFDWHQVASLEPLNVLVNHWWHEAPGDVARADSAFDALHAILSIRALPPETRRAWATFFTHYVFSTNSAAIDHIPSERRGILGELAPQQVGALREHLLKKLGA